MGAFIISKCYVIKIICTYCEILLIFPDIVSTKRAFAEVPKANCKLKIVFRLFFMLINNKFQLWSFINYHIFISIKPSVHRFFLVLSWKLTSCLKLFYIIFIYSIYGSPCNEYINTTNVLFENLKYLPI